MIGRGIEKHWVFNHVNLCTDYYWLIKVHNNIMICLYDIFISWIYINRQNLYFILKYAIADIDLLLYRIMYIVKLFNLQIRSETVYIIIIVMQLLELKTYPIKANKSLIICTILCSDFFFIWKYLYSLIKKAL